MSLFRSILFAAPVILGATVPAWAGCHFGPFSFFPDRNDTVAIDAVTQTGNGCTMAFKPGPGYRFTSASFLSPPPHGVLAKTGPTKFLYLPFDGYKGADTFALKLCAIVQGRSGCSSLQYRVDVQ